MADYVRGLVSVIMPTYKRADMLTRAIESVLGQSYRNLELLLVNDNEPNDKYTFEVQKRVVKYQKDKRFNLIFQEKHVNGAVARNEGIRRASGEYIAFLDDDDWWEVEKIEKQVKALIENPDYGVVSCRIKKFYKDRLIEKLPLYPNGYVYKDIMMLIPNYATGTLLFRHDALDKCGYFDEKLRRHQDLQLLVNFTFKYKLLMLDDFLHCADVSDDNNRPNVEGMKVAKEDFFVSISPIFETLAEHEKRDVLLMHRAEIGYIQLKHRKYISGFISMLHLVTSYSALSSEIVKLKDKIRAKREIY